MVRLRLVTWYTLYFSILVKYRLLAVFARYNIHCFYSDEARYNRTYELSTNS